MFRSVITGARIPWARGIRLSIFIFLFQTTPWILVNDHTRGIIGTGI